MDVSSDIQLKDFWYAGMEEAEDIAYRMCPIACPTHSASRFMEIADRGLLVGCTNKTALRLIALRYVLNSSLL